MKALVEDYAPLIRKAIEGRPGRILRVSEVGRDVHLPMSKFKTHRVEPCRDARLASVYFLPAANEADDDRPFLVAVQI